MNVKEHAVMRILQRKHKHDIINDNSFPAWKKTHPEETEQARTEIEKIWEYADREITGRYSGKDNKTYTYKFHTEIMVLLVADKDNIISYWEIKFSDSFDEETNRTIFESMWSNRDRLIEEITKVEAEVKPNKERLIQKINIANTEVESLREQLKLAEAKRNGFKTEFENVEMEKNVLNVKVTEVEKKLVHPLFSL